MTRRLVAAILVTVLVTLLVVGASTLVITRWQARATTERELVRQAESLAAASAVTELDAVGPRAQDAFRQLLVGVREALRADGIEFVVLADGQRLVGRLPDGIESADLDVVALDAGRTVSGHDGSLVFAAAPRLGARATVVAVVTREATVGLAGMNRWFVVAAVFTLALGVAVATFVGSRLARPVRQAGAAARRIAAGDLSARLPEPPPADRDELAELTRSINAMAAGLQRSRVLEQQFLLSVSHDLRTPLTSIRGYAEAIADGATEDTRQAAAVIVEQSARLARLVDDLLALARLDGRDFSLHVIDHDVRVPVGESVDAFGPAARQAGLEVALATGPVPVMVTADPVRVAQILGNLLENAAKYAGGRIAVTVGTDGPHAVLAVDDDGPGISPDDLSHVFERLYVARHRPVRAEVGSGLGLSIVSQLAAAMGGSATAGSSPGGGARIEVRLRRATSDAVATVVAPNATAGS